MRCAGGDADIVCSRAELSRHRHLDDRPVGEEIHPDDDGLIPARATEHKGVRLIGEREVVAV